MAASHGRRRSNTSPSTSQAPGPRQTPMPLESGDCSGRPPMGKDIGCRISQAPGSGRRQRGRTCVPLLSGVRRCPTTPTRFSPTGTSARTALPSRRCSRSSESTPSKNSRVALCLRGFSTRLTDTGAAPGLDQLPPAASEAEALAELRALADANTVAVSMIGQGYYDTYTPPVLLRNILENPAWYTAYTPYQPEISQGRLEALLNFQTMVADLTGLEVANASMLDEGTAAAEAMTLMHRAVKGSANRLAVDVDVFAQTAAVLATRAEPLGIEIVTADLRCGLPDLPDGRVLRRHRAAARRQRPGHRLVGAGFGGARPRCAGGRRRGPAGADVGHAAGGDRRRRGVRQHPTFRCANGIRRTTRRIPGGARQARPPAAGSAGRRLRRRRRLTRVPVGAADPRAAHPSRQGDQQHLHRPGAVGGDGRDVRELPRRRRTDRHRPAGARPRRGDRRRTRRCVGARQVLRHGAWPGSPAAPTR